MQFSRARRWSLESTTYQGFSAVSVAANIASRAREKSYQRRWTLQVHRAELPDLDVVVDAFLEAPRPGSPCSLPASI